MDTAVLKHAIESGKYDDDLDALHALIGDRLTTVRRSRTLADYKIGDRVKLNDYCGTQYIRGMTATVVGLARTKMTIKLDHPIGRFSHVTPDGRVEGSEVKVPPSIVDLVR